MAEFSIKKPQIKKPVVNNYFPGTVQQGVSTVKMKPAQNYPVTSRSQSSAYSSYLAKLMSASKKSEDEATQRYGEALNLAKQNYSDYAGSSQYKGIMSQIDKMLASPSLYNQEQQQYLINKNAATIQNQSVQQQQQAANAAVGSGRGFSSRPYQDALRDQLAGSALETGIKTTEANRAAELQAMTQSGQLYNSLSGEKRALADNITQILGSRKTIDSSEVMQLLAQLLK